MSSEKIGHLAQRPPGNPFVSDAICHLVKTFENELAFALLEALLSRASPHGNSY